MNSDITLENDLTTGGETLANDKLSCEYDSCEKIFSSKKSLKEHTRIHNDEKPYIW
jgi:uncharacterized Zn-finger protein